MPHLHTLELRLDAGYQRRDASVTPFQHFRDAATLAGARVREGAQRGRQTRLDHLAELLEILRRLLEHAGPAQHLLRGERARIAEDAPDVVLERAQALERARDDLVGDGPAL